MPRHAQQERIEEEASLWAARLEGGGMTDADRAALDSWLGADPEHRWVLSRYRQLSAQLDDQLGLAAESITLHAAGARRRRWRRATVACAAAAAVAVLFFVLAGRPDALATKTAERHVTTLDDGSRVELNAQTELVVDFRRHERHVRLARGEALFNVAKDSARPFVVETPAGVVRVTGTVFNVRAAHHASGGTRVGDRVEVTVLEGTVRVRPGRVAEEAAPLTAGRQAVMQDGQVNVRALPEGAVQDVAAWRQGQVVFDDTPLADAIERFAAYHTRVITVDPAAADLRLGGRYSFDDLDGLLEAVGRVLPVRLLYGDAGTVRIVTAGATAK